jgi:uncharacterized membrane protein
MDFGPLLRAPLAVQIHFFTVVPAFFLGTWLLFLSRKGSTVHRTVGKVYLALMAVTAVAAIFIRAFGSWAIDVGPFRFGLLHLFVLLTANGVWGAFATIRQGDIRGHQRAMRGMYIGGLVIAGLLAFAPGRVLHRMVFGPSAPAVAEGGRTHQRVNAQVP